MRDARRLVAVLAAGAFALAGGGCALGPKALEQTHGKYYEAVRRVDEEQLLRNLVHMRYVEAPAALDVASIAAQYELQVGAEARPFFIAPNPSNSNIVFRTFTAILPDLMVSGASRPTVTLDPADDGQSVRKFLTPITLDTLSFLTQSGWPVESIARLWVERLNGVPNGAPAAGPPRDLPPDGERFRRATQLMQAAQDREVAILQTIDREVEVSGPLPESAVTAASAVEAAKGGFEYRRRGDGPAWVLVRKEPRLVLTVTPGCETSPEMLELAELLNLKPGLPQYDVVVNPKVADPAKHPSEPSSVLRVTPRSTAQAWFFLASGVEVPAEHYTCGLVRPSAGDGAELTRGLFAVHACKGHKPPPCAYAAVKYRDHWYYIDDRDTASKATFVLVLQLSRMDFKRQAIGPTAGPALTLPVGR